MDRQDVIVMTAILTTVSDAAPGGIPSGFLYAVLMGVTDLGHYQSILATLKSSGYVEERSHFLTATPAGVALGKELNDTLREQKEMGYSDTEELVDSVDLSRKLRKGT